MKKSSIDPANNHLALLKKIRKWRTHNNISISEAAAEMGHDAGRLSRYETGKMIPMLDAFCRTCDAIGLKIVLVPIEKYKQNVKN